MIPSQIYERHSLLVPSLILCLCLKLWMSTYTPFVLTMLDKYLMGNILFVCMLLGGCTISNFLYRREYGQMAKHDFNYMHGNQHCQHFPYSGVGSQGGERGEDGGRDNISISASMSKSWEHFFLFASASVWILIQLYFGCIVWWMRKRQIRQLEAPELASQWRYCTSMKPKSTKNI